MAEVIVTGRAVTGDKPVVAYRNLLESGVVTASSEAAGFEKENAFDGIGTDYWMPAAGGVNWIQATTPVSEDVDYVAIGRHTLGTESAECVIQHWNGAAWTNSCDPFTPVDDDVLLVLFDAVSNTQHRLHINCAGTPRVGALSFGRRLTMEQGIFAGHAPEKLNRVNRVSGGRTEGGAFLPSNIVRSGVDSRISLSHLSASFVFAEVDPLMRHLEQRKPFFWAWRPLGFPDQVVWAKAVDDPRCVPMQPGGPQSRGFWQLSCSIRGVFR